ncbi:MAG: hypothetical protein D6738_14640 [Acidobacteria bacterium]|nr:MAG: hypothetical protein D6738_14640 [Acidobacteriota bacterium]
MRKRLLCRVRMPYEIELLGPTLIKSGNETGMLMEFVRTRRAGSDEGEIYLPGTSLKGVLRAHGERVLRTLKPGAGACYPYLGGGGRRSGPGDGPASCGSRVNTKTPRDQVYRDACGACRLFGELGFTGRVAISDAYPVDGDAPRIEVRHSVAIDRRTGGSAGGALFQAEVAVSGRFRGTIEIENFETWQLGLLAVGLRDLAAERLTIGMGASRGFGHVRASWRQGAEFEYVDEPPGRRVAGIERLATDDERRAYALFGRDDAPGPELPPLERRGLFLVATADPDLLEKIFDHATDELRAFATWDSWPNPRRAE